MSSDPQHPYDPYATGRGHRDPGGGHPDPEVTQTWEGQTWDTRYQPTVGPGGTGAYQEEYRQQPRAAYPADHSGAPPASPGTDPYPPVTPYPQAPSDPYVTYGTQVPAAPSGAYGTQTSSGAYGTHGAQTASDPYATHGTQAPADSYTPYGTQVAQPLPPEAPAAPRPATEPVTEPADGPAYSTATVTGSARITDAQRARAEGRSPIIDPGMRPAVLTAVLGVLLAVGAALGPYGLLLPVVLLQAVTAAGWFRLNGMWPARQGIALAFAGGLAADVVLLATGRAHAPAAILGTLGVWVLLTLVLQLRSHADPDERMYGLMATVASAALTIVATGHLGAAPEAVIAGALAVAAAVPARALPLPAPVSVVVALLAAAGAGIVAGSLGGAGVASGALLGLGAGACALAGLRVAAYDYPSRFVHMTAGVALPLALAAPAVHLLGRVLV
ncbi:hypothetical protein [Streptomyces sp. NPDC048577]|uniref:hypothetical protein n=1 Tax=Streptomyces sp. NPDC048577 TaxID=3157209 RepID=UPI0034239C55